MRLLYEIHRYYQYDERRGKKHYPVQPPKYRHQQRLSPLVRTPLQLLVLVAIGAAIAQFLPALWCMMLQFGSVIVLGVVVYGCYRLFSRR